MERFIRHLEIEKTKTKPGKSLWKPKISAKIENLAKIQHFSLIFFFYKKISTESCTRAMETPRVWKSIYFNDLSHEKKLSKLLKLLSDFELKQILFFLKKKVKFSIFFKFFYITKLIICACCVHYRYPIL